MEVINMDLLVKNFLTSMQGPCSPPVLPQLALEIMVNPPSPGDASYEVFTQVRRTLQNIIKYLFLRVCTVWTHKMLRLSSNLIHHNWVWNILSGLNIICRLLRNEWNMSKIWVWFFFYTYLCFLTSLLYSLKEILQKVETLTQNAQRACEFLNGVPGMSCQQAMGGVFLYPRLHLPAEIIQEAKVSLKQTKKVKYVTKTSIGPAFHTFLF